MPVILVDRTVPDEWLQRGPRPNIAYASGPNGWTANDANHIAFGPRTASAGRRFRSRSAHTVRTISAAPPMITVRCSTLDRSDHRFFVAPTASTPTNVLAPQRPDRASNAVNAALECTPSLPYTR